MIWLMLALAALVTGAMTRPRWTVIVWPAVSVGLGIYTVAHETASYDMHGFGYYLGGITAAACVVTWLGGRLVRRRTVER